MVNVLDGDRVEPDVMYAEAERFVVLFDEQDSGTEWRLCPLDVVCCEEFVDLSLELGLLCERHAM